MSKHKKLTPIEIEEFIKKADKDPSKVSIRNCIDGKCTSKVR